MTDIPVPTLKLLLKELKKVEKWFELGVYLDVPVDQLKKIESSYHQRDLERCKIDMLQYWLDNDLNVSWKNVAQALKQIDQHVLAETVKQQYLCGDEGEGILIATHTIYYVHCMYTYNYLQVEVNLQRT